jgi:hypothetical protein
MIYDKKNGSSRAGRTRIVEGLNLSASPTLLKTTCMKNKTDGDESVATTHKKQGY